MTCFNAASIMMTDACNLACDYCFERQKGRSFLTEDTACKAIDFLANEAVRGGKDYFRVTFFGGEPLLNLPAMTAMLRYGVRKSEETGLKAKFNLITNGTIYTPDVEAFLTEWHAKCPDEFYIQVSMDGTPRDQDAHRKYPNGAGSAALVEENVSKFLQFMDAHEIPRSEFCVHSVVTKETLPHMYASYQYLRDLLGDEAGIWPMLLHEEAWSDDDRTVFRGQLQKIADQILLACIKSGSAKPLKQYSPLQCKAAPPNRPCGAGVNYCSISENGDIFPCHGFAESESMRLGTLESGIDAEKTAIFEELRRSDLCGEHACGSCSNYSCKYCIATNYTKNGSLFVGFPAYCRMCQAEDQVRRELNERLTRCGIIGHSKRTPETQGELGLARQMKDAFSPLQVDVLNKLFGAFEQGLLEIVEIKEEV